MQLWLTANQLVLIELKKSALPDCLIDHDSVCCSRQVLSQVFTDQSFTRYMQWFRARNNCRSRFFCGPVANSSLKNCRWEGAIDLVCTQVCIQWLKKSLFLHGCQFLLSLIKKFNDKSSIKPHGRTFKTNGNFVSVCSQSLQQPTFFPSQPVDQVAQQSVYKYKLSNSDQKRWEAKK